jgi:glycosyltransferase involved in cell wall biosynthesis
MMVSMRLLLVVATMRQGGAERIVIQLAADAVRRGDAVTVASAGGPWVERVRAAGADHVLVPLDPRLAPATLGAAVRLAAVVRRFRPELVHAQNVRATVAAALALALIHRGRRPALLTTVHGLAPQDFPSAARWLRLAGSKVIACAPAVGRALLAAGFPGRLEVITNGVAVEPPSEADLAAARRRFAIGSGALVVGIGPVWRVDDRARQPPREQPHVQAGIGGVRVHDVGPQRVHPAAHGSELGQPAGRERQHLRGQPGELVARLRPVPPPGKHGVDVLGGPPQVVLQRRGDPAAEGFHHVEDP